MVSMIERVARAMVAEDSGPEGSELFDIHWKEFGEGYMKTARVAIEAMREPTDIMLHHMDGYSDLVGPCAEANTKDERLREFRCAYMAAIDAALKS